MTSHYGEIVNPREQRTAHPRVISCLKVQRPGDLAGDSDLSFGIYLGRVKDIFCRSYMNFERQCHDREIAGR